MLAYSAMIRLQAAVIVALCVTINAAAYARYFPVRDIPVQEIPATHVATRNVILRNLPAHQVTAPYMPAREIRAQDLPPDLTREQVLSALDSRDDDIRYGAYVALGVLGKHEDLPLLFSALYDNDKLVRKIAEDAIWKVWGRSGNPAHDRLYQHAVEQMQSGELSGAVGSCASSFCGGNGSGSICSGAVSRSLYIVQAGGCATGGQGDEECKCTSSQCGLFHVERFLCWKYCSRII